MPAITSLHALARHRWWVRWMLAVMLLAALAPTVSRAMMFTQAGAGWVELCTSAGTRWVQLTETHEAANGPFGVAAEPLASPQPDAPGFLDACGYCVLASERFASLMGALPAVVAHAPPMPLPVFAAVERTLPVAVRLVARGPPVL